MCYHEEWFHLRREEETARRRAEAEAQRKAAKPAPQRAQPVTTPETKKSHGVDTELEIV